MKYSNLRLLEVTTAGIYITHAVACAMLSLCRNNGVFITKVEADSQAEQIGLKKGDEILQVNGQVFITNESQINNTTMFRIVNI